MNHTTKVNNQYLTRLLLIINDEFRGMWRSSSNLAVVIFIIGLHTRYFKTANDLRRNALFNASQGINASIVLGILLSAMC